MPSQAADVPACFALGDDDRLPLSPYKLSSVNFSGLHCSDLERRIEQAALDITRVD